MISTFIIKYKLNYTGGTESNLWHQKLVEATERAKGFIDRTELSPVKGEAFHTVVLRFNTADNAKEWMNSELRSRRHFRQRRDTA